MAGMQQVLGNNEDAVRCADKAVSILPISKDALDGPTAAVVRAAILDRTGNKDAALVEYQRLFQVPCIFFLNVHLMKNFYSTLHGDPRFEAMLKDPKNNAPLF